MKKFELKLKEIARSHITKQEGVTTTIVQELMTELDLPRNVANQLAMQMRSLLT